MRTKFVPLIIWIMFVVTGTAFAAPEDPGSGQELNQTVVPSKSSGQIKADNEAKAADAKAAADAAAAAAAKIEADKKAAADAAAAKACGAGKGLIDPNCTIQQNLEKIYPVAVRIIALLAFLGVIYAGYLYITSFGQADRITEAKNWLIAAITGVILILLVPVIISTIESLPLPGR